ncbi:hypothetical protein A9K55_002149 [Cordyceps militaris]|uniref:Uncharacterized protein n=1 Tax=Cordyceps militaris TaxID=73501 RepID=A0A2H4SQM7_CORMI|nr:hypothetical protein A9K55_002149 [Cordyceps militaris]
MSSSHSDSTLKAKASIERTGVYLVKDAEEEENNAKEVVGKGRRFARFFNEGYYTRTPQGLDFVFRNTMNDIEIRGIVLSIIPDYRWGYSRYFSARLSSEYAWFFHNRDERDHREAIHTLLVQFWMPGSRVIYYEGSQLQFVSAKDDSDNWGLLNTPLSNMKRDGIITRIEDMPNGGYRVGWTCERGGFMNIALGTDEQVAEWGWMELPDTQALRSKVAELESQGFRGHFTFRKFNMSGQGNNS